MYIKFNTVERGNPAKPESRTRFYPSIQSSGRVTLRDLAGEHRRAGRFWQLSAAFHFDRGSDRRQGQR